MNIHTTESYPVLKTKTPSKPIHASYGYLEIVLSLVSPCMCSSSKKVNEQLHATCG